jgi:hypothetical protein
MRYSTGEVPRDPFAEVIQRRSGASGGVTLPSCVHPPRNISFVEPASQTVRIAIAIAFPAQRKNYGILHMKNDQNERNLRSSLAT